MKKYLCAASLFLANNEILSWIALAAIAFMLVYTLLKDSGKAGMFD